MRKLVRDYENRKRDREMEREKESIKIYEYKEYLEHLARE